MQRQVLIKFSSVKENNEESDLQEISKQILYLKFQINFNT